MDVLNQFGAIRTGEGGWPAHHITPAAGRTSRRLLDKEVVVLKRLAFLIAGGALFLLLGALPVLADGGPHAITVNNGSTGINKDSCAGCHRAHTAQAPFLLTQNESNLCLTCHSSTGNGATTDVMNGIQYRVGETHGTGAVLGALRGGGFANARIDSDSGGRLTYTGRSGSSPNYTYPLRQDPFVPVLAAGQPTTSKHFNPLAPASAQAWGQGANNSGAGTSITLECTSCHNPHGNGYYRILNPTPGDGTGAFPEASADKVVLDVASGDPTQTYNYTVIQKPGTGIVANSSNGDPASYLRYASDVVTWLNGDASRTATAGDYFHRTVPWFGRTDYNPATGVGTKTPSTGSNADAPNARPVDTTSSTDSIDESFNTQITAWCSQCHTRYNTQGITYATDHGSYDTPSGDSLYMYRHGTSRTPCTTCHVAHGSNAVMTPGSYSATETLPNGTVSPDSRLLKIDNRGTCQACHDPTETVESGTVVPSAIPTPIVP